MLNLSTHTSTRFHPIIHLTLSTFEMSFVSGIPDRSSEKLKLSYTTKCHLTELTSYLRDAVSFCFQGNAAGLVYTDLIEKCYLTLTQVRLHL